MEEDAEDPREPAHLDYKYLKAYAGPLQVNNSSDIKEKKQDSSEQEKEGLLKTKSKAKLLPAYERKRYGGIRMCQRCLRTKVRYTQQFDHC